MQPTAFDHFLAGERLREQGLHATEDDARPGTLLSAIAAYEHCLEQEADHFWAHLQKGRCHLLCNEPELALGEFNAAVALKPNSPWALSVRGFARLIPPLKDLKAAERDFNEALKLDPNFAQAKLQRGMLRLLQKQFSDAKIDFAAVSQEHPGNLTAMHFLATADYELGNFVAAAKLCDEAPKQRPDQRMAQLLRVQIDLGLGNDRQARADLDRWLRLGNKQLDPASARTAAVRCRVWRQLAEHAPAAVSTLALKMAATDGQAAVAGGFKSAALHNDLGAMLYRQGKLNEAIAQYGQGLDCPGTPAELALLRLLRGAALVARKESKKRSGQQDFELAKEDFTIAAQHPGDDIKSQATRAEGHAMLGYIAARQSAPEQAQREAALAVAQIRSMSHWTIWENLACVYNAVADGKEGGDSAMQDAAMMMLTNAISQANRAGRTDEAVTMIIGDAALQSLQQRPDFQKLISKSRP